MNNGADDVLFDLQFYDASHERALRNYSVFAELSKAQQSGIAIPYDEYKSYVIFREQSEQTGYQTFAQLQEQLSIYIPPYEDYYQHDGNTIYLKRRHAQQQGRPQTEAAGVGAALSVASRLYGLTEADWQRIPEGRDKDVDFMRSNPRLASNGKAFIRLEAKGHAVDDPQLKGNLASDVHHIKEKKVAQRVKVSAPTEFIGFITSFPTSPESRPRIWVVDPPQIPVVSDPRKLKILKRLYYYWKALGPVLGGPAVAALINRIYAIASVERYEQLDGVPLLTRSGAPVEIRVPEDSTNISQVNAFGQIIPIEGGSYFYYGFDRQILQLIEEQNFDRIAQYRRRAKSSTTDLRLTAVIKRRNASKEFARDFRTNMRMLVPTSAKISTSSAGRVFGHVNIESADLLRRLR